MIPLFKSHYSFGKSILTLENEDEIRNDAPVSIVAIAKKHNLKKVWLVEDNLSSLMEAYSNLKKNDIQLVFGYRVGVYDYESEDDAIPKYIIFAKNHDGYGSLTKISTISNTENISYSRSGQIISKISIEKLKDLWTKNLVLAVPFYDSFIYTNSILGTKCAPNLDFFDPVFFSEPEDDVITAPVVYKNLLEYCKDKNPIIKTRSVYYYLKNDFKAWLTNKCIHNRSGVTLSTLEKPEQPYCSSNNFCFENYLELNDIH